MLDDVVVVVVVICCFFVVVRSWPCFQSVSVASDLRNEWKIEEGDGGGKGASVLGK
jgi:ABC-type phosphate transport system permease subunit